MVRTADWERAIMTGYAVWRQLHKHGGGRLELDLITQTLALSSPDSLCPAGSTTSHG
ncbi:hypothetical protein GCM10009574_094660 [Streptomyces asiaticus]|uniref:MazG C-terminal domain-containing protein n=2 Tax=Streptomyces rhizosphaericus TaxID=114699 RepID=A0ABN1SMQ7_9ACTN